MNTYKQVTLTGKNADNFAQAVERSKQSRFNYKKVQNDNLPKLKELSRLLSK